MIAESATNCLHESIRLRDNSARSSDGKASDAELVGAIARGDQLSMRQLYERHSTRVYRFARRLGADHSAAEDLVSEVFLDVWRCGSTFAGRARVSTWLLAITRNKALDIIRRSPLKSVETVPVAMEDETDGPEVAVQKKQAASVLSRAFRNMSAADREIIDLVYYHESSINEVARILNIPKGTVKTRMFYARKRLSALLAQCGQDASQLLAYRR
jgi:RNA polymerase sigma-70 factor, ECF subfamily